MKKNSNILDKTIEYSVANAYLLGRDGFEYFSSTLSMHQLEKSVEEPIKVIGGQARDTVYSIAGKSDFSVTLTDVVNSQEMEAKKLGGNIESVGDKVIYRYHMPKSYRVIDKAGKKGFTLNDEPVVGEEVVGYLTTGTKDMIDPTKLTHTGKEVEITDTAVKVGDLIFITGFKVAASATDKVSYITSEDTSESYILVLEVPISDLDLKVVAYKQYIFSKAKILPNATATGKAESEAVSSELKLSIEKDITEESIGYIVYKTVV